MSERDDRKDQPAPGTPDPNANEGEGSKSAAEKYDRELQEFEATHDPERLAEEAERDLDADTGELAEAEEIGRSHKQEPTFRPTVNAEKPRKNGRASPDEDDAGDRDERRAA